MTTIAGLARLAGASLLVALLFAGCAGELPEPGKASSTMHSEDTTSTTESVAVRLGKQVGATWSEGVQKLVPLLQETPAIASVRPAVTALKEEYVQKMVALGQQIFVLDPDSQQAVKDRAADILASTAETDWFKSYVSLYDVYAARGDQTSQDFAVFLSTFNTLTNYAFFDVLKALDPAEATRLGIQ